MSEIVYEAAVHTGSVSYRNFNGLESTRGLTFALDPVSMLEIMSGIQLKPTKSADPRKRGTMELADEDSIKLVRNLVVRAAGFPTEDGESWIVDEQFEESLYGQAFLTRLMTSEEERKGFVQQVFLAPLKAFVEFAKSDPTNSKKEVADMEKTYDTLVKMFSEEKPAETLQERRARLAAEMEALEAAQD